MAEKVEIDIPGIGLIEAKNAATEATLQEILAVLKGTQKDNNKNAKGGKGGGGGDFDPGAAALGLNALNKQAGAFGKGLGMLGAAGRGAGLAMNAVGKGAGIAVGGIGRMAGAAGIAAGAAFALGQKALGAAESMTNLINELANVGDSTTAAAGALRHIPIVGGVLSGVLGAVASASENVVKSYQTAASVGATFGGSVQEMSRAASGAGMTLDKFAGLIQQNGESLMMLGGTTEEGAKQFGKLAKEIQGSEVGSELQRLGYSTEQINGGMARYIGMLGKTGALQGMNTQQLVASSGAYMKELDALAKITGVSREEKEKEQARLMADAKVRAAMAGLDADQQRQMMAYITSFPKEQQAAIADMIATGNTTTEEAIQLQSLLPGVAQRTMEFGRTLQAGGKINQDALNQAKNSAILEAQDSVKRNKMRGMYDEQAGKQYVGAAELAAQKVDGYSQAIGEQAKAAEKNNLAEQLTKSKQKLAEFSNGFQMALANSGLLDALMTAFGALAGFVSGTLVPLFTTFVVPAVNILASVVGKLAAGIQMILSPVIDSLTKAFGGPGQGLQGVVETIGKVIDTVFGVVAGIVRGVTIAFEGLMQGVDYLISPLKDLWSAVTDLFYGTGDLGEIFIQVGDYVGQVFRTLGFILGGVIDVAASVVRWFGDLVKGSSFLTGAITSVADTFRTYFSPEGFKAMYASIKNFFINGISDFIGDFKDKAVLMFAGLLQLIGKIPGLGKLADAGKEMEKEAEERKKQREEAAAERQKEIDQLHQAAKNQKTQRDARVAQEKQGLATDKQAFADKKLHVTGMGGLQQREREQKEEALAAGAKDVTVDMADPIQMLKTFANQQKSAFTQEAKALDDKQKAQSELAMASSEYAKAIEARGKATNDLERKAAEDRVKAAEERLGKANKTNTEADEAVKKAAERMKLAKEGKDPGAVAEGRPATPAASGAGTAGPTAQGTPATAAGPQEGVKTDAAMAKYLQTIALIESGGNKNAKAGTSSASGMFQFVEGTWKQMTKEMGKDYTLEDRFDPKKAAEVAEYFSKKQKTQVEKGIGREAGMTDMYMAHFLGAGGATKFLKAKDQNPQQSAAALDPAAAKANKNIYYTKEGRERTVQEVYDLMDQKVKKQSALVEQGKVNADVAAIGGGAYKPGQPVGAVAPGTPSSGAAAAGGGRGGRGGPTAEELEAHRQQQAQGKPPAVAEGKPSATEATPITAMQTLINDGIVPTTIAFQDLVNKGLKPFQGMMSGMQVKTDLDAKAKAEARDPGTGELLSTAKDLTRAVDQSSTASVKDQSETQKAMNGLATNMSKTRLMYDQAAGDMYLGAATLASTSSEWYTAGDDMMLNLTQSMKETMDDSFDWFGTDLSSTFASFDSLESTFNASVIGLDTYTKQIAEAEKQIGIGEANIAMQEEEIAKATAALSDPSVTNKEEIQAAVDAMRQNIEAQKETIAYNKDVVDKNIMARAETPLTELVAQAQKDAEEKQRLAEEAAQKEKDSMTSMMAGAQEGGAGSGIDLNTALAELIAINKRTADLNERQLSVQSQLSGDLFA